MEEVEGVIVSAINYSETSKILNIITKEHGLIGVIAKGARNMKSPFRSFTDKLTYANFMIYYKEDKLSTLTEVNIINSFKSIKKDINKISYAAYLLELAEGVIKQNNDKNIYEKKRRDEMSEFLAVATVHKIIKAIFEENSEHILSTLISTKDILSSFSINRMFNHE